MATDPEQAHFYDHLVTEASTTISEHFYTGVRERSEMCACGWTGPEGKKHSDHVAALVILSAMTSLQAERDKRRDTAQPSP